ncbi:hypothetical protein D8L93_09520 [Sodalis-like symbiont of Bactericera trigonica]|nr:hypothetical protein D8L93_09520 [Sodalis-like symbiont of Bactericera trigonica]
MIFAKPTYGLDLHNSLAILERISQAAAQGVAMVLISTDLDELLALSHRVAVMRRGQISGMVVNNAHASRRIGSLISGETP